jgi:hypothetical protein
MKKILLTGAMLLALSFSAKSQTLLNGTFNDEAALAGWNIIDADGDTFNWGIFTGDEETDEWGFDGDFAGSRSYSSAAGALTPDNYLISPVVAIPANGATLNFLTGYTYYLESDGNAEQIDVYVSTSIAPTPDELSEMTPVFTRVFDTETDEEFVPIAEAVAVSLAEYAGQSVRIAFRHSNSENQNLLLLDSVIVTAGVASVKDNSLANVSVYPNPSSNVVNVNSASALVNAINFTDLNGRIVKSAKFNGAADAQVNISDLASGVYMMNISSDKGTTVKKIVKN